MSDLTGSERAVQANGSPPGNPAPPRFPKLARVLALLIDPKVLSGGVLAFVVVQGIDQYKTVRKESREDVVAVREKITELVKDMPANSAGVAEVIARAENLFIPHLSTHAREYLAAVVGQLSDRKAQYLNQERAEALALEAARVAAEAKARSEIAARTVEEAKKAQASNAVRLQAEAGRAADEAIAAARLAEAREAQARAELGRAKAEASAYMKEQKWDRTPRLEGSNSGLKSWPSPAPF